MLYNGQVVKKCGQTHAGRPATTIFFLITAEAASEKATFNDLN
jgi:hypothetical protein